MQNYTSPSGEKFSVEQLAELVKDWHDKEQPIVIEQWDNITVVNDGLYEFGSKARFIDKYVSELGAHIKEIVYASPTTGFAQISLAYVCAKYGKKAVLFEPERSLNKLHAYQKKCLELGGEIHWVKMGMTPVLKHHAKKYVDSNMQSIMAPFGFDNEIIVASIIKVAQSLKIEQPDEVWSVAGSGTLSRGLQLAFPKADVYAVSVGHKLSEREKGHAVIFKHKLPFHKETKILPPFPSAKTYDAKAWEHIQKISPQNKNAKILFWNVAP